MAGKQRVFNDPKEYVAKIEEKVVKGDIVYWSDDWYRVHEVMTGIRGTYWIMENRNGGLVNTPPLERYASNLFQCGVREETSMGGPTRGSFEANYSELKDLADQMFASLTELNDTSGAADSYKEYLIRIGGL